METIDQYILDHISPEEGVLTELNRQTYLKVLRPRMISGHLQGQLLYLLCKLINPKRVLEIGTYTGYSAISMARGMTFDATLDTIEINDELRSFAQAFVDKAGLESVITLHTGSALDIVPTLNCEYDLIFIDGDKREYTSYYQLVLDKLRPGGVILADNVLWDGKVVEPLVAGDEQTKGILDFNNLVASDLRVELVILPIRDGLSIIRKKG